MKVGITGATRGFGKALAEHLCRVGENVRALVRPSSDVRDLEHWGVELVEGDLLDPVSVSRFVTGLDVCHHVAAKVGTAPRAVYRAVNVEGTRELCEAVLAHNPRCHVVYCSSNAVGNVNLLSRAYVSDYSRSKHEAERVVSGLVRAGLRATIIRPGYIYGPHDRNFLPGVVGALKKGIPFFVRGGERDAPIVHSDDLAELFRLAGGREVALGKRYFSIARSELGMHDFLRMVARRMGYAAPERIVPRAPLVALAFGWALAHRILGNRSTPPINMRMIGLLSNRANGFHDEAAHDLGWGPAVAMSDGIERALEAWRTGTTEVAA